MLLDHFHPPLKGRRHWQGFHHQWASALAADLNRKLPRGWFAEPNIRFGIEVDVGAFQELAAGPDKSAPANWHPPSPALTIDYPLTTDVVEVQVLHDEGGPRLVGAVELVSPANKDRPEARDGFVSKCETYLREGVGLVVVDIVTERLADLHAELLERLGQDSSPDVSPLHAAAYRPTRRAEQACLEIWHEPLWVGGPLPSLPLFLQAGPCVEVDLAASYAAARRDLRLGELLDP